MLRKVFDAKARRCHLFSQRRPNIAFSALHRVTIGLVKAQLREAGCFQPAIEGDEAVRVFVAPVLAPALSLAVVAP